MNQIKIKGSRKTAKLIGVERIDGVEDPKVYVNGKFCNLADETFRHVLETARSAYRIKIRGGGVTARIELVKKVLSTQNEKLAVRYKNTDSRKKYAKVYGGKGARSRFQKSYR